MEFFDGYENAEIRIQMGEFANELSQIMIEDKIKLEKRAKEMEQIILHQSKIFSLAKEVEYLKEQNKKIQKEKHFIEIELNKEKMQAILRENEIKNLLGKLEDLKKTNELSQDYPEKHAFTFGLTSFNNEGQNMLNEVLSSRDELKHTVEYLEGYTKKLKSQQETLEKKNMLLEIDNSTKENELSFLEEKCNLLQKELCETTIKLEDNAINYEKEISYLKNSINQNNESHLKEIEDLKVKSSVKFAIQIRNILNERNKLDDDLNRVTDECKRLRQSLEK